MATQSVTRTVQYWRLVDAKDNNPFANDIDWQTAFSKLNGDLHQETIDGRKYRGNILSLNSETVKHLHREMTHVFGMPGDYKHFAIELAAEKGFIPNQQDVANGEQSPVGLNAGWEAVDNSFIWHLPYGNMIAFLMESQSSGRPIRYAQWLTSLARKHKLFKDDQQFSAIPVIDVDAANQLKAYSKMRSIRLRTNVGQLVSTKNPVSRIFEANNHYENVEVTIEIKTKAGSRSEQDEEQIYQFFEKNFGHLSEFSRAEVKTVGSSGDITEIDLIQERLARKKTMMIEKSGTGSNSICISSDEVFPNLIAAFETDHKSLHRLKDIGR